MGPECEILMFMWPFGALFWSNVSRYGFSMASILGILVWDRYLAFWYSDP